MSNVSGALTRIYKHKIFSKGENFLFPLPNFSSGTARFVAVSPEILLRLEVWNVGKKGLDVLGHDSLFVVVF